MKVNGVVEVPSIPNGSAARAIHQNGYILLNKEIVDKLNPIQKDFIILHEEAHLILNTKNEELCDEYAMKKLIEKGYPLSKILSALTQVLPYDKLGHFDRTNKLFNKLFLYDLEINKNKNLLNHLNLIDMTTPESINLADIYAASYEGEYSDFLGIGKRARQRRQERHQARMEKKKAKADLIRAKAEGIRAGTYDPQGGLKAAFGAIGNVAGAILGKGHSHEEGSGGEIVSTKSEKDNKKEDKSKMTTYIIIVVVVILLIVVAYFLFSSKKRK